MTKQVEVLFQNAAVAAKKLKCPAKFERVSELRRIMAYGVMTLPALVIDGHYGLRCNDLTGACYRRQSCGRRQRAGR